MLASGGEADFSLTIVCWPWRGLRSLLRSHCRGAFRPKLTFSLRKARRLFVRNGPAARPRQTDAGQWSAGSIRLPVPFQQPGLAQAFDNARLLRNEGRVVGLRDACPDLQVGIDFAQFGDRLLGLSVVASPGVGDGERGERPRFFLHVIGERFFSPHSMDCSHCARWL
jgi:hypothetical protein